MAWRSSGTNNDEMVNNLRRYGVIHTPAVEQGFRAVDRRWFVPQNMQSMAHTDQPLKEGHVHISAPHIYGSVVEALELTPNSSLSFLNLGCGTGYLSSIVAQVLGPTSSNIGIDVHRDAVEHCRASIQRWRQNAGAPTAHMDVIHGNALQIDNTSGEGKAGFDRIYIGASVGKAKLASLVELLRPGGILVGPVDDELIKVVRMGDSRTGSDSLASPLRTGQASSSDLSADFSKQVLSAVRFAPLVTSPSMPVIIPSQQWSTSNHHQYPESFRKACKEILLCARADEVQAPKPIVKPMAQVNAAGKLPRALWMEILSYTRRDWFEQPKSEVEFLRKRLEDEQAASQRAQEARMEAETRLHMVERERDVYRMLAMRWQARLQAVTNERRGTGGAAVADDDSLVGVDDIAEAFANEPLLLRLGGIRSMMRQFQAGAESDDDDDDDAEDAAEEAENNSEDGEMDADNDDDDEEEVVDMEDADEEDLDAEEMSVSPTDSSPTLRPQVRTVSISSEASL